MDGYVSGGDFRMKFNWRGRVCVAQPMNLPLSRTRIAGIERNSAIGSSAMCPIQTFLSKDNKIHLHVGYQRYIAHKDFVLY